MITSATPVLLFAHFTRCVQSVFSKIAHFLGVCNFYWWVCNENAVWVHWSCVVSFIAIFFIKNPVDLQVNGIFALSQTALKLNESSVTRLTAKP